MSLLSAYLIGIRVYQESGVTLDMLATRAFAAARSGTQRGAYNSLRNNACATSTALAFGGSLAGFTATVACTRNVYDEGGSATNVDSIVATPATSRCGKRPIPTPGANYVERQITLTVIP